MDRYALFEKLFSTSTGKGVEIGTCWGGFAEFLATKTPISTLYCVDPYRRFPDTHYFDTLNFQTQEQLDQKFWKVCQRLAPLRKVEMVRTTSYEATSQVPDGLDFVYIDGNHHYNEVLKDLVIWWPKVKAGGYLCGDDVEDLNLKHTDGEVLIQHQPGVFGVYGVAAALRDFQRICPTFKYQILGNQFYAQKYSLL